MVETSVFCTSVVRPEHRFEAWKESVGVFLDTNPADHHRPQDFRARVESVMLDGIMFARCASNHQSFDRPIAKYAHDGLDHYMVQLFLEGGVEMYRGSRLVTAKAGALVGFDLGDVLDSTNTDFDLYTMFIPRRRLSPMLHQPDSLQGAIVDTEAGAGALLADYLHALYRTAPELNDTEAASAAEALLRLIAMAFNSTPADPAEPADWADHAVVIRARAVISDRLQDPGLNPDEIAAAIGVSRARLYRAFRECGGVMDAVRELRLRRCFTDIVAPSQLGTQIATIAYRHGFQDPAHFTRAFKQRFGATPGEVRGGRGLVAASPAKGPHPGLDRTYEHWIAGLG